MAFHKYLLSVSVMGFCFALDQATKIYAHTHMVKGEPIHIIRGFFDLNYVRNAGGAFGLLNNGPDFVRYILFLVIPIFCVGILVYMLKNEENKLQVLALSFILGGAAGNYIDRIRLGYVVDFIDWYVGSWHWPTFNLADSFIVVGVCILSFFYLTEKDSTKN